MQKLQLYISNTRVDLFKDESVSITQTIQNVRDIKKIFTEFTQTFTIPASKTNNKLFKHFYNFDIENTFDARNKVSAKIELNNIPFKKGFVKLEGVQLKKNKPYSYKITFFGETVNLKDLLGDDELSALSSLNSENLTYNATNVKSKLISSIGNIVTPLITHGKQLFYDSNSSSFVDGTGNLFYHTGSNHDHGVLFTDLKFAIRLSLIITAIETKYGITFSTDFLKDTTNTAFHNLFMWLHRKKGDVQPAEQVSKQFAQLNLWSTSTQSPQLSTTSGALVVTGDLVTFPNSITGHSLSLTPTNSAIEYDVQVFRNGSLYYQSVGNTGTELITDSDFTLNSGSYTLKVGTADASGITFNSSSITWEINGTLGGEVINGNWTDNWRNGSSLSTSAAFEFVITEQIPKMKIIDFLTGIFQMFNLTAFVDETGTIVVRTLDSFYNASTTTWTIDEYVKTETSTVDSALPFKQINLGYKGLGTFLAKQFEQLENRGWGTLGFTLENATFDGPQNDYTIEIPFEHLQYQRLVNANNGNDTSIQWGWFADDNEESYYDSPLIFYPILKSGENISFRSSTNTHEPLNSYVVPSNSKALSSSTSTDNIHFQLEINEFTGTSTFTGTLFENYYKNYLTDVFNNKRRLTKVNAQLPLKIIYNLKLNDKVSLNNNNYLINSITTNLTTGESSLELLNIV